MTHTRNSNDQAFYEDGYRDGQASPRPQPATVNPLELDRLRQLADGLGAYAGGMDLSRITEMRSILSAIQPATVKPLDRERAPVQGFTGGIPWAMHLRAYDAYCNRYSQQEALIEGGCRGGFGTDELDVFIPGWREELDENNRLRAEIARLSTIQPEAPNARAYSYKQLADKMADKLNAMTQEHDLQMCYSMAVDALDMHTERSALIDQPAPAPQTVQEAARVLLDEFTSDESGTDFKPAWRAWKTHQWDHDGSIYGSMAAFLRALSNTPAPSKPKG